MVERVLRFYYVRVEYFESVLYSAGHFPMKCSTVSSSSPHASQSHILLCVNLILNW